MQQTVAFLQAGMNLQKRILWIFSFFFFFLSSFISGEGHVVAAPANAEGLPANYMTKPNNWVQPKPFDANILPDSLEGRCNALKAQILSSDTSFLQLFEIATKESDLFAALLLLIIESGVEVRPCVVCAVSDV